MLDQDPVFSVKANCIERDFLTVSPETNLLKVLEKMSRLEKGINTCPRSLEDAKIQPKQPKKASCVLVKKGKKLVGLLTERDIVRLVAEEISLENRTIAEVMTRNLITYPESEIRDYFELINLMQRHRIRHLPIVDQQGQPVGIVTYDSLSIGLQPANLLRHISIAEVMQSQVIHGPLNADILSLAQLMAHHRVSCIVISEIKENGAIVPKGILTERDIVQFKALRLNLSQLRAAEVMSYPLFLLESQESLWLAHYTMQQRNIRRLVITNERGELAGIITQTSILQSIDPYEMNRVISTLKNEVKNLKDENTQLLQTLNQNLEEQVNQKVQKINLYNQQEKILFDITLKIRSSLNLETILSTTVEEIRHYLQADRAIICYFSPNKTGEVIVESVAQERWSILHQVIRDECFENWLKTYQSREIHVIVDREQSVLDECYLNFLRNLNIKASLVAPLYLGESLWGLLSIHHCERSRNWLESEVKFLENLIISLEIALQQATYVLQIQENERKLEQQVAERTATLEKTTQQLQQELRERQQTENALRETENRFRFMADHAPVLIWIAGTDSLCYFFNKTWLEFTGRTLEEEMGNGWAEGVHPDDLQRCLNIYLTSFEARQPFQMEYRLKRFDGEYRWLLDTGVPNYDSQEQFLGYIGSCIDISDRKVTEAALQHSEARFQAFMNNVPMIKWINDAEGKIIYANQKMLQFLNKSEPEVINHSLIEIFGLQQGQEYIKKNQSIIATGEIIESTESVLSLDGHLNIYLVQRFPVRLNEQECWIGGFAIDITEQEQAKQALSESEARFRSTFEQAAVGMCHGNLQGYFIRLNQRFCDIVGYRVDELLNLNFREITYPDDLALDRELIPKLIAGDIQTYTIKKRYIRKNRSLVWVNLTASVVRDDWGHPLHFIAVIEDINEQKKAEEALQKSEARFQSFMNYVPMIAWINSLEGMMIYGNQSLMNMLQKSPSEVIDHAMTEIFPEELAEEYMRNNQTVATTGQVLETLETAIQADGSFRNYLVRKFPVLLLDGTCWVGGIAIDVTEQESIKNALRNSEAQYRHLIDNLHAGVVVHTDDSSIILCNSTACELLGLTMDQMFGRTAIDLAWHFFCEDGQRMPLEAYPVNQVISTQQPIKDYIVGINRPLDHSQVWVLVNAFPEFESPGILKQVIVTFIDITSRKQAEDALQKELSKILLLRKISNQIRQSLEPEQIFKTAAQTISNAFNVNQVLIFTCSSSPDLENTKVVCVAEYIKGNYPSLLGLEIPVMDNPYMYTLLAQDRAIGTDDVYTYPLLTQTRPLLELMQLKSLLAVGTFYQGEVNGAIGLHHCDDYHHWSEDEIELLEAVAEQLGIAIAQANLLKREKERLQEIESKNKDLQRARQEAEAANRAKSEFLANMSHEIRTPMNAVLGFADLLKNVENISINPEAREYLEGISSSGKTLMSLINDILDLSKIEAGKLTLHYEAVNIRSLIQETCHIFRYKAGEKGLKIETEIEENLPPYLELDEVRLRQILLNVVGNALKFTEKGGITIICQSLPSENSEQVDLEIRVKDTGIGIIKDNQEKIFNAFTQSDGQSNRKYGGTGLGLAITHRLVEMMGGRVTLESELGKGSQFIFYFPQINRTTQKVKETEVPQIDNNLDQFEKANILVVDDVASNRHLLAGYFAKTHHYLLFAEDGQEAVRLANTHHPDVILLDLRMPNMDGREAAQILKKDEQTQDIPILVITASAEKEEQIELEEFCQGFLPKPVSRVQLVAALKGMLKIADSSKGDLEVQGVIETIEIPENTSVDFVDFAELGRKLEREMINTLPKLKTKMIITDLEVFVEKLEVYGQEYPCEVLLDYIQRLRQQVDNFDFDEIPKTLEDFNQLREFIQNLT